MHLLAAALVLLQGESDVSVRVLLGRPVVRTDSREYDAGVFSTTINLVHDAGLPDRVTMAGLEVETGPWRFAAIAGRLRGEKTLAAPMNFEEEEFPAGARLRTTFDAGWVEAVHRIRLTGADSEIDLRGLIGLNFSRFRFDFTDGVSNAHEAHPALWPVPAAGLEGRLPLFSTLALSARFLSTRLTYVNPFHEDGGTDSRIVFNFIRAEGGLTWKIAGRWSAGVAFHRFTHYLRDTSREDRHRVWFDATSLAFSVHVEF